MANPQREEGHLRIANELWDQLMMRDFSKRQRAILDLVLRLSYGCGKKTAVIPTLNSFALAGVRPNHVRAEIEYLEKARVLVWNRETMRFAFKKDYDKWWIQPTRGYDPEKLSDLIALNVTGRQPLRSVPKTGTNERAILPETGSDNSNQFFPKQEPDVPKTGSGGSQNGKSDFPKQEHRHPSNPINDAGYEPPKDKKDTLKTLKDSKALEALAYSEDMATVFRCYHKHIGMMGPTQHEKLCFWVEDQGMQADVVCEAIVVTVDKAESPGISYIEGILRNWYNAGIRTLDDLKAREPPKTLEESAAKIMQRMARLEAEG